MVARLVHTYPNQQLRKSSEDVSEQDWGSVAQWCCDLRDTAAANSVASLAAPQVGIGKKIFVLSVKSLEHPELFDQDFSSGFLFFINPKIFDSGAHFSSFEESCLSVPGFSYKVKRSSIIDLQYTTQDKKEKRVQVCCSDAALVQHELDHLCGKLFIDRLNLFDRKTFFKALEKPKCKKSEIEIEHIREQRRARLRKNRKK